MLQISNNNNFYLFWFFISRGERPGGCGVLDEGKTVLTIKIIVQVLRNKKKCKREYYSPSLLVQSLLCSWRVEVHSLSVLRMLYLQKRMHVQSEQNLNWKTKQVTRLIWFSCIAKKNLNRKIGVT